MEVVALISVNRGEKSKIKGTFAQNICHGESSEWQDAWVVLRPTSVALCHTDGISVAFRPAAG